MSNCNFCCNLVGEQAEIVLIMMGGDVCCVFGHCLFQSLPCECLLSAFRQEE